MMKLFYYFLLLVNGSVAITAPLHDSISPEKFLPFDEAFRDRAQNEKALVALEGYRKIVQQAPKDTEALWRLSMACQFVGLRLKMESEQKLALFAEGRDAGRASLLLAPQCAPCHFWTAINMALYGQEKGVFKMIFSLKEIESHLESSLALDSKYAYSGAHRLLGLISQTLPGVLGGSNQKARLHFEKAIAQSEDEPMNYLLLIKLLREIDDGDQTVLALIQKALSYQKPSSDRIESLEAREELEKLWEEFSLNSSQHPS